MQVGSEGEAPEPKVNPAGESSSRPGDAKVMAKSLLHERQQVRAWGHVSVVL
jgi:hypothetical protein